MTDSPRTTPTRGNPGTFPRPSASVRRIRIGLIVIGFLGIVLGAIVLLRDVAPTQYIGIGVWMLGALIVHDGIAAAGIVAVQIALRKVGRRVPLTVIAILQGAILVGAIVSLLAFPGIYKSAIGANNATVVPLDYGQNLIIFYVALITVTALVIGLYLLARRQKMRSSSSHA